MKERLQFLMEGGSVVRYHTRPGIRPDTDAHHSHGVAMLVSILAGESNTGHTAASATLLMAALTHDLGEQYASDVSAPAKRALGLSDQLQKCEDEQLEAYNMFYTPWLSEEEKVILKLADIFDGMLYCCRELSLGNKNALLIWRRFSTYATQLTTTSDINIDIALRASVMFESIKDIYHEVTSIEGPNFDVFASK